MLQCSRLARRRNRCHAFRRSSSELPPKAAAAHVLQTSIVDPERGCVPAYAGDFGGESVSRPVRVLTEFLPLRFWTRNPMHS